MKKIYFIVLLFSIGYWYCALIKPFPSDSFYSWIYSQKCSFKEIILLKDSGIGHPPLFHLLQKTVQTILPGYSYIYLRIINFIAGCIFLIILISNLKKNYFHTYFLLSLAISTSLLDTYVFARMWGIVVLIGIIFYLTGEKYLKTSSSRIKIYFIGFFFLGLFADYNFILLLPYFLIVFLKNYSQRKKIFYLIFLLLLFILFCSYTYIFSKSGANYSVYLFISNIIELSFLYMQYLVNFNYLELILIFIFPISFILFSRFKKKQFAIFHKMISFLIVTTVLYSLLHLGLIRARMIMIIIPLILYIIYKSFRHFDANRIWKNLNVRIIVSIISGSLILLAISPVFWADLIAPRFIAIFFPMIIILLYKNLSRTFLNLFAIIFILSGINYMVSAKVSDTFPASIIDYDKPIIYDAPRAYATQYLKNRKEGDVPMILNMEWFEKSCRVCTMGTSNIDFQSMNEFRIISWEELFPDTLLDRGFEIVSKYNFGLTKVDQLQFNNLTPIIDKHFYLYEMRKIKEDKP